jgi:SAM-dependent methyltransferase
MTESPEAELNDARKSLRPTPEEAASAWRSLVIAERAQVERLPNRPKPEDFYAPVAESFRADARRAGDPLLDYLLNLVQANETWLDVGAGGGRYTLPLALRAKRMYAVEPSQGMREVLAASAREGGITNLEIFDERWPSPQSHVPVADVGFISQVGYDISEFAAFLDQLEAHSRRMCVAVLFERSPIAYFARLWALVHGEQRVLLPGLGEFIALLFARGRRPELKGISLAPRVFESLAALHQASRRPLWVGAGTSEDQRLSKAVEELARPYDGGFTLDERPRYLGAVTW